MGKGSSTNHNRRCKRRRWKKERDKRRRLGERPGDPGQPEVKHYDRRRYW
jgi:hypothetical protein